MKNKYLSLVEGEKRTDLPDFQVGDTVDVHQRILEGQKERIQVYSGTVIARRGEGGREMFTVRRIVQGEGVERIFPLSARPRSSSAARATASSPAMSCSRLANLTSSPSTGVRSSLSKCDRPNVPISFVLPNRWTRPSRKNSQSSHSLTCR